MLTGQTIGGHYEVIQFLGEGGFGQTFLAKDIHLPDQPYWVVKRLNPPSNDPFILQTSYRLFDTEAKVLYQLGNHPQIPQLFAHFQQDDHFYLVQEYIQGHDLSQEIQPSKTLSETQVIDLLKQVLEVLSFVHQQSIIHRDIKPSNLIRSPDNCITLIDFGAVKQTLTSNNPQKQNSPTIPIGTKGYSPPEQLNGFPKLSSDIYTLGVVAIQALSGIHPEQIPQDPNTFELLWKNYISVSPNLTKILEKMLSYSPEKRYPSATETLQALNSLNSTPPPHQKQNPPYSFLVSSPSFLYSSQQ